jgi:hypothetical protein
MFRPLLEAVRREADGGRALDTVRAVSRHHRIQSSPGYDDACRGVAAELDRLGLEVSLEHVPGDGRTRFLGALMPRGWRCRDAFAAVTGRGGREVVCDWEVAKLSLVQRSAPAAGRFPIRVVEDGSEAEHYRGIDVRGAVVLTRGAAHRVHRLAVVERGAAGVLCDGRRPLPPVRGEDDEPDQLAYTSFWWNETEPRGWGFVLSPRAGAALRARLAAGEALELEVRIDSEDYEGRIPLLGARLPAAGPEARGGEVLVVSHLCHPEPGANDNASGVAAALETARVLAALRERGVWAPAARSVRFLWMPELYGTCAWLAQDRHRGERLSCALNLDMVGEDQDACGSTLLIEHGPWFCGSFASELLGRIRREAPDWVETYSGPGHHSRMRMAEVPFGGGSDHAVLVDPAVGVPCPMLIQWPDRYYHSSHDTPERCDPASLALAVRCAATYAGAVAAMSGEDRRWLLGAVERGHQRRLLDAVDAPDAARVFARERERGAHALRSLMRLGLPAAATAQAGARLQAFALAEERALSGAAAPGSPRRPGPRRVPARSVGAPLDGQRHLLPGWEGLDAAAREAWLAADRDTPGGPLTLELAWYACDGRRDLTAIGEVVWLETGQRPPVGRDEGGEASLEGFFERTTRLGLSGWKEGR